jgi:hypothetical protein
MMEDHLAQLHLWRMAQAWLIQTVPDADFQTVYNAKNWREAIDKLKETHSIVEEVNSINLINALFDQKLQPGDTAASIISRCRTMASSLESLHTPVSKQQLLSAVIKLMQQDPVMKTIISQLMAQPGNILTIEQLQISFNVLTPPTVAGAFLASASLSPTLSNPYAAEMEKLKGELETARANLAKQVATNKTGGKGGKNKKGGSSNQGGNRGGYNGGNLNQNRDAYMSGNDNNGGNNGGYRNN